MLKKLIEFIKSLRGPRVIWCVTNGQFSIQFTSKDFKMRVSTEQKVQATVKPQTQAGNPAPIDGAVTYTSSNTDAATIDADGLIVATGVGITQITASFDADRGEGVRTIELTGVVEVVAAEATTGVLEFGEPTLQ